MVPKVNQVSLDLASDLFGQSMGGDLDVQGAVKYST